MDVGEIFKARGDVTTLNWIMPGAERRTEQNLGYESGRLARGYFVGLLIGTLGPETFQFAGTTLRSGGRLGLPGATPAQDAARLRVHDQVHDDLGAEGYLTLQKSALKSVGQTGPKRLAKVFPTIRHDATRAPSLQYPMGGGGLQWTITSAPQAFFIALHVDGAGLARTPEFELDLTAGGYEARAKLRQYLNGATG